MSFVWSSKELPLAVEIINGIRRDASGKVCVPEVKQMFGFLLGLSAENIPDEHEELVFFCELGASAQAKLICKNYPPTRVKYCHDQSVGKAKAADAVARRFLLQLHNTKLSFAWKQWRSVSSQMKELLTIPPERTHALAIVESLTRMADGNTRPEEVKEMFSLLLEIPINDIPDDHRELKSFCGLDLNTQANLITAEYPGYIILSCHKAMVERSNAAAETAKRFLLRSLNQKLSLAWEKWITIARQMVQEQRILMGAVSRWQRQKLSMAFEKWESEAVRLASEGAMLKHAVKKLTERHLACAFEKWLSFREQMAFEKHIVSKAMRCLPESFDRDLIANSEPNTDRR